MIQIDGKKIKISQGDTFDVTFNLKGYSLSLTDRIIFSVKDKLGNGEPIISKEVTNIEGNIINIKIPYNEMESLQPGVKLYDLVVINSSGKYTLMYPSTLEIVEVVHNE